MKKFKVCVAALAVGASALMMNSCIGSFGLTNKVLDWNQKVTNEKFVNWLVFLVFWAVPVYEFSLLIDALVLNTMEFWTGSSPLSNVDKIIKGSKGTYHVKSNANGYDIELLETGEKAQFIYNQENKTWSAAAGGKVTPLFQYDDKGIAKVIFDGGMTSAYAAAK